MLFRSSRELHPREDVAVGEFADPEGGHRGDDDAPAVAEHELIARLARPAVGGGQRHDHRRHEGHEGERRETCPDHPPRAGIAIDKSAEHTYELQSLMRISYAVFCLKKKITQKNYTPT